MEDAVCAVALQEWAAICAALMSGEICLIARKGGIHERGGGLFAAEHQRFWLLPSHLHQEPERLRPPLAERIAPDPEPQQLRLEAWAELARVWRVEDFGLLAGITGHQPYAADELARRFAYRDQPWLVLLALRVHRLASPHLLPRAIAHQGCRSWIALGTELAITPASPALPEAEFARRLTACEAALTGPKGL